jgi:hypothetical protein
VGSAVSAAYNLRLGRGDRKGARQLAAVAFTLQAIFWVLTAAHVPSYWELHLVMKAIAGCGLLAAMLWSLYIAIEPHVRRNWPDSLISWSRLQRGQWRDPLVASHILTGTLVMTGMIALRLAVSRLSPAIIPLPALFTSLTGASVFTANLAGNIVSGMVFATGFLLLVVLMRLLARRVWIADVITFMGYGLAFVGPGYTANRQVFVYGLVLSVVSAFITLWVMRRFGLLSLLTAVVLLQVIIPTPIAMGTWYTARSLVALCIPAVIAAWAMWVIASSPARNVT